MRKRETAERYRGAIEACVLHMHSHYASTLRLDDLASVACMSRHHFLRVFQETTQVAPGKFLTSIRMAIAKRLVLRTDLPITEICSAVGYESLGTFVSSFGRYVGIRPSDLRRLVRGDKHFMMAGDPAAAGRQTEQRHELRGGFACSESFRGTVFVGFFREAVPLGRPDGGGVFSSGSGFRLSVSRARPGYILAAALPVSEPIRRFLHAEPDELHVARTLIDMHCFGVQAKTVLRLRPPGLLDPPIVLALPVLLARFELSNPEEDDVTLSFAE